MSGGFTQNFTVAEDGTATISFTYRMWQDDEYESDEYVQTLVSVDGELYGTDGNDHIAQLNGGGDTGWQTVTIEVTDMEPGEHSLVLGGYGNEKTYSNEYSKVWFDEVSVDFQPDESTVTDTLTFSPEAVDDVYDVDITTVLSDNSETLDSVVVIDMENVPADVEFSAGALNEAGDWEIPVLELNGLTMTAPAGTGDINLSVSSTSAEGNGDTATSTVTAIAEPPNTGPEVSGTPEFAMNEDGTITITPAQLLTGATDADGDTLSVENLVVNGGTGTLVGPDGNGSYTYTPDEDFSGSVSLEYDVSDGEDSVSQTATVNVAAVADEADLSVSANLTGSSTTETAVDVSQATLDASDASHDVTISGVPDGAVLNAGVDNGDGTWSLSGDLLDGLTITPADGESADIDLSISVIDPDASGGTETLINANFDGTDGGFSYIDDAFRDTDEGDYAKDKSKTDDADDDGYLRVELGGKDDDDIEGMSGGFTQEITVSEDGTASLTFSYKIDMNSKYESDEYAEVLVSVDGELVSVNGNDYIDRVHDGDVGWTTVTVDLGELEAGAHEVTIGGFNNKKTEKDEKTKIDFDDISMTVTSDGADIANEDVTVTPEDALADYDLDISAAVTDDSETITSITVDGLPEGTELSAGTGNADGTSWTLTSDQLADLTMSVPIGSDDFSLSVSTVTQDGTDTETTTQTLDVHVPNDYDDLGTSTDDTLTGTDGADDELYGGAGDDEISGMAGNDELHGGSGDDTISGGDGMDTLYGGSGVDYLDGGDGNDVIYGDQGDDVIIGGEGNDQLYGGEGADEFVFNLGDGDDTVFDFEGGDQLTFDGISLGDGDTIDIAADGDDVVITVVGQNGGANSKVTLKDAAKDKSDEEREAIGDGYSVTDMGDTVTVIVDTIA